MNYRLETHVLARVSYAQGPISHIQQRQSAIRIHGMACAIAGVPQIGQSARPARVFKLDAAGRTQWLSRRWSLLSHFPCQLAFLPTAIHCLRISIGIDTALTSFPPSLMHTWGVAPFTTDPTIWAMLQRMDPCRFEDWKALVEQAGAMLPSSSSHTAHGRDGCDPQKALGEELKNAEQGNRGFDGRGPLPVDGPLQPAAHRSVGGRPAFPALASPLLSPATADCQPTHIQISLLKTAAQALQTQAMWR